MVRGNDTQFIKVPLADDLQRTQHIKVPQSPQPQPSQAPAQPAQQQSGGTTNDRK